MVTIARLLLLATLASSAPVRAEEPSSAVPSQRPVFAVHPRAWQEWRALGLGLGDSRADVRARAEKTLAGLDAEDFKALVGAARGDRGRRTAGPVALRAGARIHPILLSLLEDPALRFQAGTLLFDSANPQLASRTAELLACVRGKPEVKNYCGDALVKASGPHAKAQVPLLSEALADPDASVRLYAAAALGLVGRPSGKTRQALKAAAKDSDPAVRAAAKKALGGTRD